MRLETSRLFIRHVKGSDWQEMKNIFIDFNSSKYAVYDMPLPTEDAEVRALTKRFADSNLFFAVIRKESNDMIGYVLSCYFWYIERICGDSKKKGW